MLRTARLVTALAWAVPVKAAPCSDLIGRMLDMAVRSPPLMALLERITETAGMPASTDGDRRALAEWMRAPPAEDVARFAAIVSQHLAAEECHRMVAELEGRTRPWTQAEVDEVAALILPPSAIQR